MLVQYWRNRKERYQLTGTQCDVCDERFAVPKLVCPACHHKVVQRAQHIFPTLPLQPVSVKKAKTIVTVIIPTYNAATTIRATLSSVLNQDLKEPYRVIVIDSSDDRTPDIISREFPRVRLIHNAEQIDPGTARNLGITIARGEIIAFLEADCVVPRDWLSRMVAAQRAGHLIVGGSVEHGGPDQTLAWASYLDECREFIPSGEPRPVRHVPACNVSYHRSIFARFGGFPTTFYPQQDRLFHWQLAQQDIEIWFDPNIRVKRTHPVTWRSYLGQQRRIGHTTAQVLDLTGDQGALLARSSLLALLALPFSPALRFSRAVAHLFSRQPGLLRKHWTALPALLLGLYAWGSGFVAGAWDAPWRAPAQGGPSALAIEQNTSQ